MIREVIVEILNTLGYYRKKGRTLSATRDYVETNKYKKDLSYTPNFHLTAPIGWLNDPNGFIFFQGKYHLFYQYNPYDTHWGPMYWGHSVSEDLITWTDLPVAMAPDSKADKGGVWSGSAIEKDGKLFVIYSGNIHKGQVQNIAYSEDGINFTKYEGNPVISGKQLPSFASTINFRDPKIWQVNGIYYAVIASKVVGKPAILLYRSKDIYSFEYLSTLIVFEDIYMRECPDYFTLGDKKVLLMSSKSGDSTVIIGHEENNQLIAESEDDLDYGLDFYAPQTTEVGGRRIMTAWMHNWNEKVLTGKYGYAGMMIIPREITLVDGKIWIEPVKELDSYRSDKICYNNIIINEENPTELEGICGSAIDMIIGAELNDNNCIFVELMKTNDESITIYIDNENISLDRVNIENRKGRQSLSICYDLPLSYKFKKARIVLDKYTVEVFSEGKTLSMTAFPEGKDYKITFESDYKTIINIEKYNLRR